MKGLILISICASVVSLASGIEIIEEYVNGQKICRTKCGAGYNNNGCPQIPCDRPPLIPNRNCPEPSCLVAEADWVLWPIANDPTSFWQCPGRGVWQPIKRACGCATLFDFEEQRCVHPHEYTSQCVGHPTNPQPTDCPVCPTCDETTTVDNGNGNGNGNQCPCQCICINIPCQPCPSLCPCNNRFVYT